MPETPAAQLLALLNKERKVIASAQFAELDDLATRKNALFETVQKNGVEPAEMDKIHKALAANQTLLAAAITGVKAASDRLAALRAVRSELSVYDQSGRMAKVQTPRPGLEKKA